MRPIRLRARALRQNTTEAERHLWRFLRRHHLAGRKFRRQHPIGSYVVDFVCLSARLVIELDGGQHLLSDGYDEQRTAQLEKMGFRVQRFWNDEVLLRTEEVLQEIWRELGE
jgi:very-short-patch-repair endonuclease